MVKNMAVLRTGDIKKLTKAEMLKKLEELSKSLLEVGGSNKKRPVKTAIARLKTFISKAGSEDGKSKVPEQKKQAFKKNP